MRQANRRDGNEHKSGNPHDTGSRAQAVNRVYITAIDNEGETDMYVIDKSSHAYAQGFTQGFSGKTFRNPCEGNATATNNHYFGFLAGESAKTQGFASREAYEAAQSVN
jgi:hypothetical protein